MRIKHKLLLFLAILTFPILFFVQPTLGSDVLTLSITKGNQSGRNYSIPIIVTINSTIDSDRFEFNLDVPEELKVERETSLFSNIEKDKDYELEYSLTPTKGGSYEIVAEGILWQADATYKENALIGLNINKNLELEPVSDKFLEEKKNADLLATVRTVLIVIFVIIIGVVLIRKFLEWFRKD